MRKSLLFGSGMAIGYVLGAKAGSERYEQILAAARSIGEKAGFVEPSSRYAPSDRYEPEITLARSGVEQIRNGAADLHDAAGGAAQKAADHVTAKASS